ncbi:translesion DNA synthesis-associated protein ImuA [Aestuariirhabdus litorea]|uniref:translesion DNA synthesis-associated protein ImuA n=1 Tax=Aestuariirhabdus litorea TaxID=2528527 RepID=UPI0013E36601|nr:translesion DNA synthesis-associated protein ImuA [Aestuariirhabdus litorea]
MISTGYSRLDEELPGGGWPVGAVTDLHCDGEAGKELRLLLPVLALLSQQQERWLLWVAPPLMPSADVLRAAGVNLSRVLVVRAESVQDRVGVIEQALLAGQCSGVLGWLNDLDLNAMERLQAAASEGGSLCLLLRHKRFGSLPFLAPLCVRLSEGEKGVDVEVLKRQGGWPVPRFAVQLENHEKMAPSGEIAEGVIRGPWVRH